MDRTEYLLQFIDTSKTGLEIGTADDPMAPTAAGWRVERAECVAGLAPQSLSGLAEDALPVFPCADFLIRDGDIASGIGKKNAYDFVIGSHAVFRLSDFLGLLKDCENLLKDSGTLTLAVPDKRFFQSDALPVASTELILRAHEKQHPGKGATTLAKLAGHAAAGIDRRYFNNGINTAAKLPADDPDYSAQATENDLAVIKWGFTPAIFRLVLQDLNEFGEVRLGIVSMTETQEYEFFATLKKNEVVRPQNRITLLRMVEAELGAVAPPPPAVTTAKQHFELKSQGWCPVCEEGVTFSSTNGWLRDHFVCSGCASIPRERAVMHVLQSARPDWRTLAIHESSPADRSTSLKLRTQCSGYVSSQFDPSLARGASHPRLGYRCEDLNHQTFADASFDIVVTQDVFEHVPTPEQAIRDIGRTLRPGGMHICSVPIVRKWGPSETRALLGPDGTWTHLLPPQYHGNPIDEKGSLVVTDWGYDIAATFQKSSGMDTVIIQIDDLGLGIRAEFIEVLVSRKR